MGVCFVSMDKTTKIPIFLCGIQKKCVPLWTFSRARLCA